MSSPSTSPVKENSPHLPRRPRSRKRVLKSESDNDDVDLISRAQEIHHYWEDKISVPEASTLHINMDDRAPLFRLDTSSVSTSGNETNLICTTSTHAMNHMMNHRMPSADCNLAGSLVSTTIPCSDGNIDAKLCKHLWLYLLNKARPQDAFKAMQGVRWRKQASADAAEAIQNTSHFSFYSISFKCAFSARKKRNKKAEPPAAEALNLADFAKDKDDSSSSGDEQEATNISSFKSRNTRSLTYCPVQIVVAPVQVSFGPDTCTITWKFLSHNFLHTGHAPPLEGTKFTVTGRLNSDQAEAVRKITSPAFRHKYLFHIYMCISIYLMVGKV